MHDVSSKHIGPAFNADTLLQMAPYLAKFDFDAIEFLDRIGIAPNLFLQHDAWFERDKVLQAGNELARMTGNPFAGAYAGDDVPIAEFGTWGTIVSQAETTHQACALMSGKLRMVERGSRIMLFGANGKLRLAYAFDGRVGDEPLQILLATVAMMKNVALLCGAPEAVRVHLTMPRSYGALHLDKAFGERIDFGSTFDGVEIDNDVLATRPVTCPKSDAGTRAIDTTIATAVLIDDILPIGTISIQRIAGDLCLSVRTLQRRLKYCGVKFEDLVDVTRRDTALSHLAGGASGMNELALRLGYSNSANFNRAFKRWTGKSPTHFAN